MLIRLLDLLFVLLHFYFISFHLKKTFFFSIVRSSINIKAKRKMERQREREREREREEIKLDGNYYFYDY